MLSKIAVVGVLGLAATVTSAMAYMGMSPKSDCCAKSAMVAVAESCCAGQAACCSEAAKSVAKVKAPCECTDCVCGACQPEDCCCANGTCSAEGECCAEGKCCSTAAKLVTAKSEEACASGCCAKK